MTNNISMDSVDALFEKAGQGNTEAWETLSVVSSDSSEIAKRFRQLENSGVQPKFEPTPPERKELGDIIAQIPIVRKIGELITSRLEEGGM